MKTFTIEVTVAVSDKERFEEIGQCFAQRYGDQGPEEDASEFLSRKLEEFVLSVYEGWLSAKAQAQATEQVLQQTRECVRIRGRNDTTDKPKKKTRKGAKENESNAETDQ